MSVDPKAVTGRRKLHFDSFDEVLADAEMLISAPTTKTLGNWPLGQLLTHLAKAINGSIDGIPFRAPWTMRTLGFFIKGRLIKKGLRPGIKLPKEGEAAAYPRVGSLPEALGIFRRAVDRLQREQAISDHPMLGKLTHDQWVQLHLRHAELHLSFARPS